DLTCQNSAAVRSPVGRTSTFAPPGSNRCQRGSSTNPSGACGVDHAKARVLAQAPDRVCGAQKSGTSDATSNAATVTCAATGRGRASHSAQSTEAPSATKTENLAGCTLSRIGACAIETGKCATT